MNVAIFWPNWIGDAVMATPAVRALRAHYRDAHIIGVLKPYIGGVVEGSPWHDELIFHDSRGPWPRRWPAVAWKLRQRNIDFAVLFPNTFRSALIAQLAGCQRRIGFDRYGRGSLLTDRLQPKRDERGRVMPCPIIDDYNRLAVQANCPLPSRRLELFTTELDEAAAARVWHRARFGEETEVVCLNPGAAFGSAKFWSAESFAAVAQKLADQRGCGVLVLCGPSERELVQRIAELSRRPQVVALADHPLSLGLTKACVRRSALLITTDSGPRHFAAAFDRPVITLFGPTHIAWTETYHPAAIHLQKAVPCGPCQLRVCPLDHQCMKLLSPEEVFATAVGLLKQESRRVRETAA